MKTLREKLAAPVNTRDVGRAVKSLGRLLQKGNKSKVTQGDYDAVYNRAADLRSTLMKQLDDFDNVAKPPKNPSFAGNATVEQAAINQMPDIQKMRQQVLDLDKGMMGVQKARKNYGDPNSPVLNVVPGRASFSFMDPDSKRKTMKNIGTGSLALGGGSLLLNSDNKSAPQRISGASRLQRGIGAQPSYYPIQKGANVHSDQQDIENAGLSFLEGMLGEVLQKEAAGGAAFRNFFSSAMPKMKSVANKATTSATQFGKALSNDISQGSKIIKNFPKRLQEGREAGQAVLPLAKDMWKVYGQMPGARRSVYTTLGAGALGVGAPLGAGYMLGRSNRKQQ